MSRVRDEIRFDFLLRLYFDPWAVQKKQPFKETRYILKGLVFIFFTYVTKPHIPCKQYVFNTDTRGYGIELATSV